MIFTDLPAGSSVFLDANTLVYHFQPHPVIGPPCTVLVMQAHGLTRLASHDTDFDRVPGITRYAPL